MDERGEGEKIGGVGNAENRFEAVERRNVGADERHDRQIHEPNQEAGAHM